MNEIWKDIVGYEGLYQVSNLGNVKGLPRQLLMKGKYPYTCKEKMLKPGKNKRGYCSVVLSINSIEKTFKVHQLVAMAFLGHKPCGMELVVDHKNNNKSDNRLENLQIITNRENCSKDVKNKTSKYTGVNWRNDTKKWTARITINKKQINLGCYDCELKAHYVYMQELKKIQ